MDPDNSTGTLEITESILADTTTAASLLAVTVQATEGSAETLRRQVETMGREQFEQERLQYFANRYITAKRVRKVLYRNHPDTNEFSLAEVFEINPFSSKQSKQGMCTLHLPGNAIIDALRLPATAPNPQTPLPLPYPCHIIHTFEVQSASLEPMAAPRLALESEFLQFRRRQKSLHKYWSMALELSTLAQSVPPSQLAEHEKLVAEISQESTWSLNLPTGVTHLRPPHEFGRLPPAVPVHSPIPAAAQKRPAADADKSAQFLKEASSSGRIERRRVRSMRTKNIILLVILILSILIIGYLLFFLVGMPQPVM